MTEEPPTTIYAVECTYSGDPYGRAEKQVLPTAYYSQAGAQGAADRMNASESWHRRYAVVPLRMEL